MTDDGLAHATGPKPSNPSPPPIHLILSISFLLEKVHGSVGRADFRHSLPLSGKFCSPAIILYSGRTLRNVM